LIRGINFRREDPPPDHQNLGNSQWPELVTDEFVRKLRIEI